MTDITTTEAPESTRAFWPGDYARFQSIIREARQDNAPQADALAQVIVGTLSADSPEFDAAQFIAGTYPLPGYVLHLGRVLKNVRTGRDGAKGDDAQGIVTELAQNAAGILASVPGFDGDRFVAGTQLPQPQAPDADEAQDDEVDGLLS